MDFETAFVLIWQANHTLLIGCVIMSALFFSFANRQASMRKIMHTLGLVGLGIVIEFGRTNLFNSIGEVYTVLPSTYTIVILLSFAVGDWLSYLVHIVHLKLANGRLWIELARLLGRIALRFEAYGVHYMPAPERTLYLKTKADRKQPKTNMAVPATIELPEAEEKSIIINDRSKKEESPLEETTKPVNVIFKYTTPKPERV
jgi:hypothetical protein